MDGPNPYLIYTPILNCPNHYLNQVLNELNGICIKWHTYFISFVLQVQLTLRLMADDIHAAVYEAPTINNTVGDSGGGIHKAAGLVVPQLRSGIRIDCIDVAI